MKVLMRKVHDKLLTYDWVKLTNEEAFSISEKDCLAIKYDMRSKLVKCSVCGKIMPVRKWDAHIKKKWKPCDQCSYHRDFMEDPIKTTRYVKGIKTVFSKCVVRDWCRAQRRYYDDSLWCSKVRNTAACPYNCSVAKPIYYESTWRMTHKNAFDKILTEKSLQTKAHWTVYSDIDAQNDIIYKRNDCALYLTFDQNGLLKYSKYCTISQTLNFQYSPKYDIFLTRTACQKPCNDQLLMMLGTEKFNKIHDIMKDLYKEA